MNRSQFRLDSFRAWSPSNSLRPSHPFHPQRPTSAKVLPSRSPPDPLKYPLPTSTTRLPITPDPSPHPSRSPSCPVQRPSCHPLPARPPDEVCVDRGPRSRSPGVSPEQQMHPRIPNHSSSETALCPVVEIRSSERWSHSSQRLSDRTSVGSHTDHRCSPRPDQDQGVEDAQTGESIVKPSTATPENAGRPEQIGFDAAEGSLESDLDLGSIDPAILAMDPIGENSSMPHMFFDSSQVTDEGQWTAVSSSDPPALEPYPLYPSLEAHTVSENQQVSCDVSYDDGWQSGLTSTQQSTSAELLAERSPKRRRTGSISHGNQDSSLQSHFLSSPLEERLQFLSWLFEAALPRYMSESENHCNIPQASFKPCKPCKPGEKPTPSPRRPHHMSIPRPSCNVDGSSVKSRKRRPWSKEEVDLLVSLRGNRHLSWSLVVEKFRQQFPGRTRGSIKVYWSTKVQSRR
ncbi:hypothetical protein DTO063F5_3795 [Paecilomyces variotii]|nr:hypothetical protein DTO063F5_3795 [Paecilomyces variotii]